ncbi:hypothetical protein C6501_04230 [Candidatus Poribacteria bacterium]|nr:MAG: hypothetical protein C6501_04230 [Candidatus Poribacteria bacterium]
MNYLRTFFIITLCILLQTGCNQQEEGTTPSSTPHIRQENKEKLVEMTIGGKVWKIDPNLSYQATGVWTNSNPRPLTAVERKRLQALPELIQDSKAELDELRKEMRYLERIEKPEIKIRYSLGKPVTFSPGKKVKIINLGEFPMQMELPSKIPTEQ